MNTYLNLERDDMMITEIINDLKKKLKPSISNEEFKSVVIELDNIDNSELCEYDEEIIAKIYNNLNKKCMSQINHFIGDTTPINGQAFQTFGQLMNFLKYINL